MATLAFLAAALPWATSPVSAFQYPTSAWTGAGGGSTATNPGASGNAITITTTGETTINPGGATSTLGAPGYNAAHFSPSLPTGAPATALYTAAGTCAVGSLCDRGTVTITFEQPVANPVLHIAGLGGLGGSAGAWRSTDAQWTLATPGLTLTKHSGPRLNVTGDTIFASTPVGPSCTTAAAANSGLAGCGSVRVNGIVSSVTFDVAIRHIVGGTGAIAATDGYVVTVSLGEDFGDAPSSYDAGNAARALLSDLRFGTSATADNTATANSSTSPNAGAAATGDADDANPTLATLVPGDTGPYSVTLPLSGVSADATVCGWVDFDRSGTFQTAAGTEQVCTTVTAGATSATLTWPSHTAVGGSGGNTYARFRVGYDASATSLPTGPSDSGEVEDYLVPVATELAPFTCAVNSAGYLFQSPTSQTGVYAVDMVTGDSTLEYTMTNALNGVGYNVVDNYIYGWDFTLDTIVRVGADGSYDVMGVPAGMSSTGNYIYGEVDPSGHLWLGATTNEPAPAGGINWYEIDLTTLPAPTVVSSGFLSNDIAGIRYNAGFDWAWIDGYLWRVVRGVNTTPSLDTEPAFLIRFDPVTGTQIVAASLGDVDGPEPNHNNLYGAVYSDADGFLYISDNLVGDIYRVNVLDGAAATATYFADGPVSANNDGTRCGTSIIATDYGDAPNSYGTTLASSGPRHSLVGFDVATNTASLMIGDTVDRETDGVVSAGATGDDSAGIDDETAGPFVLAAGGTAAQITVPVTNDIGATATLYAWVDANNDGVFTSNEFASATVAPGATSATITWSGLPAALVEGQTPYIRLRLTTDVLVDDAGTAYDDRAGGPAQDGEVEDHQATVGPAPTLTVLKDVVGRYDTDDQFTLQVAGFPSATTTGSATGIQTAQIGPVNVAPGTAYSISEIAAGTTNWVNYTSTYSCVDELGATVASGSGRAFGVTAGYVAGSSITCTFTNTPILYPILAVDKTVTAGPTALGGGQYEVVYEITVTNTGRGDGTYDLTDTVALGDGVTLVSATVTDSNPPVATGPLPTIVTGRTIAGAPTGTSTVHTYEVTVIVDSPAGLPATEADCVDGDGTGSGVSNTASMTTGGQTTSDTACAPLPSTTLNKTLDSIVGNGDGTYTFTYLLEVTHSGPASTYDLNDTFRFSDAVSIVPGTVGVATTTPPGAGVLTPGFDGDTQTQIAGGVTINGGEAHIYTVTVDVTVDFPSVTPENSDCTLGGTESGTGALNQASLSSNGDTLTDEDCKPFPGLTVIKSVASGPTALGGGQFEVVYDITVTNSGQAPGTYDLDDTVSLGTGVTLVSAAITGTDPAITTNPGFDGAGDPVIVVAQPIDAATGGVATTHTYEVTVVVETAGPLDPVEGDCVDGDGSGSGVSNTATMTDEVGPQDATACAPLPSYAIAKSADATELDATGIVTYTVTVTNTGQVPYTGGLSVAEFSDDLSDVLDNATYVAASATSNVGGWTFAGPTGDILSGEGPLAVGQTATITYEVQVGVQAGGSDYRLQNAVVPGPGGSCTGTCQTDTPLPGLDIAKSASADTPLVEGGTVTYTITFTNIGQTSQTLDYVDDLAQVTDDATVTTEPTVSAPDFGVTAVRSVNIIAIQDGAIPPGEVVTVTYTVTVNTPDTGDHLLNNYVLEPGDTPPTECLPGDPRCTSTPVQSYTVAKTAGDLQADGTVTYTLTIANTGQVDYAVAGFSDDLSGVLDNATYVPGAETSSLPGWTPFTLTGTTLTGAGPLAVGETATITYTVQVNDPHTGTDYILHNVVEPTEPGGDCIGTCSTDTPLPGLEIAKTADPASGTPVVEGSTIEYRIQFTNTGATDQVLAFDDVLTAILDDAAMIGTVQVIQSAGSSVDAPVVGDRIEIRGTLLAGGAAAVVYTVAVDDPDEGDHLLGNFVVPEGELPPTDCAPGDPLCTENAVQSFTVAKSASALDDGEVTYTLTVVNTGAVDYTALDPAGFSDDLSGVLDDATFVVGSVSSTVAGWTFSEPVAPATTLTGSGPLAIGETATITYTVTVNDPVTGDYTLGNVVVPTGPGGDCDGCTTSTPIPGLDIAKTAEVAVAPLVEGGTVDYAITFTNTGQTVQTLAFDDVLTAVVDDAAIGAVAVDQPGGSAVTATVVGDRIEIRGSLPIGATAVVSYTATVDNPDTGDHVLGNFVVPEGETPPTDCVPGDPLCTESPVQSFTVEKAASALQPDGTVTYTLTIVNTGAVDYTALDPAGFSDDLSGVLDDATFVVGSVSSTVAGWTFTEPVDPGTTLDGSGPLAVGETATVTYTVQVNDPVTGDYTLGNVVVPTGPGGDCVGTCTTSTPIPGLDIAKTAEVAVAPLVEGGTVTYTITFTNTGQTVQTLAFDDVLTGVLDDAATIGAITIDQPGGSDVDATVVGDRIEIRGTLPIGATAVVSYTATVDNPDTGDHVLGNFVVPEGELPPTDCVPGDPLCTESPVQSYTVEKAASALQPDGTVTYTLTVANTGAVDYTALTPASFTDDLSGVLDNASFVAGSASSTVASWAFVEPSAGTTTLSGEGPLAVGETAIVTYTVLVNDPHTGDDYVLRNVVTPSGPGGECVVCTTDTLLPGLAVAKTANPPSGTSVLAGDTVTYTVTFTNLGDADAAVDFTDHLGGILDDATVTTAPVIDAGSDPGLAITPAYTPGDTSFTVAGSLAPGDQASVSYTVTVDDPVTGDHVLGNFVVEGDDPPPTDCLPGDPLCTLNPIAAITIVKSSTTTAVTAVGQVIPYEFLVTNTGGVELTNVTITDTLAPPSNPANLSPITCGPTRDLPNGTITLAPGDAITCYASYTVATADYYSPSVADSATATGTPPTGEPPVSPPSEVEIPVVPNPSIAIDKSASPDDLAQFVVGQVVTYSFLVTNTGNVTLTDVAVNEGTFTGSGPLGPITCPVTTLAAGESMTCTATYTITQADVDAGEIYNDATSTGVPPTGPSVESPPDDVTIPSPPEPSLTIDKSSTTTLITTIGQTVPYRFVVTNTGNVTLTGVTVNDPKIGAVTCPQTTLAPGASTTCTGSYTVSAADLDGGRLHNVATVTGTPPGGPPVTSPPDEVDIPADQRPGLSIVKSSIITAVTSVGQTIPYDFLVTNTGNVTVTGITVDDPLIPDVSCPQTTLGAGASMTCTGTYTTTQADVNAGRVVNVASVGGTPPGGSELPPAPSNEVVISAVPITPPTTPPTTPPPTVPQPDLPSTGGNTGGILNAALAIGLLGFGLTAMTRRRRRGAQ